MKIVPDTNVVVSGLLQSKGNPAQVLNLALAGAVQVCHDPRILAEYADVLARPRFKFDPRRVRDVLVKLQTDGLSVDPSGHHNLDLPDPDDEPFWLSHCPPHRIFWSPAIWPTIRRTNDAVAQSSRLLSSWPVGRNCRNRADRKTFTSPKK